MEIIKSKKEMQAKALAWRKDGKSIGFAPTMGYLHAGHLSLFAQARKENDIVVASIFVNPMQFGPQEDYDAYPRDLERDSRLCAENGVDCLFAPDKAEMYEADFATYVQVEGLDNYLCGASRPGHFRGVTTVVMKLFAICQPNRTYFGQKDIQQLTILQRMVGDLDLPLEIRMVPTQREADGLAISSRNVFLSEAERKQAPAIYQSLALAQKLINEGENDVDIIIEMASNHLHKNAPLGHIDYLQIVDAAKLAPLLKIEKPLVIATAVKMPGARLIDNIYMK
jgi:pantoate--beta-alanine ligase